MLLSHFTGEETEVQEIKSLPQFPLVHSKGVLFPDNIVIFNYDMLLFLEFS